MNPEALEQTLVTGRLTFYSRTRKRLWVKGESSGNHLYLVSWKLDCDQDSLLFQVNPKGPTCHTGTVSCFQSPLDFLGELEKIIQGRMSSQESNPTSYVAKLAKQGALRMAQKVGEEGVEVAIASVALDKNGIMEESADLLFHMIVNLQFHGISVADIMRILQQRHMKRKESNGIS